MVLRASLVVKAGLVVKRGERGGHHFGLNLLAKVFDHTVSDELLYVTTPTCQSLGHFSSKPAI